MRIAILLLNAGRGSGVVARQHAEQLIRNGHQVWFLHPRMGEGVPGAENRDVPLQLETLPVHEYLPIASGKEQTPVSRMSTELASVYINDYELALEALPDIDLFIGHHANLAAIATHHAAAYRRKPFVLFLHGTGIEPRTLGGYSDRIWARIEAAVEAAAGIIVTTDYVRDHLIRPLIDVPAERFLVLPCGVDLNAFRPDAGDAIRDHYDLPETFVITPGALTLLKGPQNVVAAADEFTDLAPVIFIGDGGLRERLERQLGDRGRFLGFVPNDHKAALINAATALTAAPEKLEHFGIIYVEAMAAGTIPVAYRGGGVDSIVTPDVGVLTDREPADLGAAVRGVLENDARRSDMAIAARARAEALYGEEVLGGQLTTWLETIVAG